MRDAYDLMRHCEDLSRQLDKLRSMPGRVTHEDLTQAASALLDASNMIKTMSNTEPRGCTCQRHEDDGRTWVTYDERCQHHRYLHKRTVEVETHYKQLEARLKETLRTKFATAALTGAAHSDKPAEDVARRAFRIADDMIAGLSKPS